MMRNRIRTGVERETPQDNFLWDHVAIEVMMDIRNELQRLNNVLQCPNFIAVPSKLDDIRREVRQVRLNTRKPKKIQKPKLRAVA